MAAEAWLQTQRYQGFVVRADHKPLPMQVWPPALHALEDSQQLPISHVIVMFGTTQFAAEKRHRAFPRPICSSLQQYCPNAYKRGIGLNNKRLRKVRQRLGTDVMARLSASNASCNSGPQTKALLVQSKSNKGAAMVGKSRMYAE